ncbi:peroxiredoxin family protein [Aliikangiella coralliicola]|uniref:Redoxin domain-containing protein n=1 Tax=Aliikangiella coralliicola TaxID=2592383 RepID=A0A545UGG2_9GAMM|nr:peroxiredoxin family protein [Aliikangiella coralliicola]TQV88547.1 redoxin domain-containing protein [Aliikangiella coralliicola]
MLLKSLFISFYLTLLHVALGYSVYQLWNDGFTSLWSGLFIASIPGVLVFDTLLLAQPVARTSPHLTWATLLKLIGFLLVVFNNMIINFPEIKVIELPSLLLAAGSFFGWLLYDYWFSKYSHRETDLLIPGKPLPELTLSDINNQPFESKNLQGSPVLYLFYRGNWCPLCMAQIREIANEYQQLMERGLKIVLISPQSQAKTQKLAKKFNLSFIYAVDKNCRVADRLGILAKQGLPMGMQLLGYDSDTVMPTVIITDENGVILFADLTDNYRVRPEPMTFLKILDGKPV